MLLGLRHSGFITSLLMTLRRWVLLHRRHNIRVFDLSFSQTRLIFDVWPTGSPECPRGTEVFEVRLIWQSFQRISFWRGLLLSFQKLCLFSSLDLVRLTVFFGPHCSSFYCALAFAIVGPYVRPSIRMLVFFNHPSESDLVGCFSRTQEWQLQSHPKTPLLQASFGVFKIWQFHQHEI